MFETQRKFMRRPPQNEECSSICTRCFATVASCRHEKDLDELEKKHVCDKDVLSRLGIAAD